MGELSYDDAKNIIILMFEGYLARRRTNKLYKKNDTAPEVILKMYFLNAQKREYNDLLDTFRKEYIYNENKNEDVHTREERLGMGVVYDYIANFDVDNDINNLTIYTLLTINSLLFSKTNYPEFGGQFRKDNCTLLGSRADLTTWENIPRQISELYESVQQIKNQGVQLKYSNNIIDIMNYINVCIALKCKLIKIHPFSDGNGRSVRAFTNLLFKIAKIPPVYIHAKEKDEYIKAMNKALVQNDYSDIVTFYYYKICDSLYQLDIKYLMDIDNGKGRILKQEE